MQFFTERARRVNPHFSLDNEMPAVIQICRLVDGIPLALELAASWAGTIDCETIAAGIQNNIDFLASTLRNMPERHRSMRAVFDQTWNYLSPQERDAFKQLSVFRGTFRLRAAEQIAAAAPPTLSALINKSLLQWDGRGCYHLHGLLRQYGEEHLMASADGVDVRERHCSYFANFLRQRLDDIHAGRQVDAMREMEGELDNLEAAWQWAVEHTRVEEIRQSLHALAWFWHYGSRFQEGADSLHTAIRKLEAGKPTAGTAVALAEVCVQYGWLCIRLGRLEEAETSLDQAQALYERLGAAPISDGGSDPLGALAMLAILKGEFARGTGLLEEARREQEARGDRRNLATTYYVQTSALVAQGRYQAAEESALEAHRLAQELNDRWSQAYTLNDLGLVTYLLGKYEKARQHYRASYAIRRQYNDREGMAVALRHLGQIALHAQESEEAEQLFRESLRLYDGTGDLGGLAATLDALGNVACARGNYLDAREHLLRALQIAMRSRLRSLAFSILTSVAELLLQCGQSQQALTTLAFVHSQPSAASDVKARAKRLLDTHADVVPPDVYADAIAQGENRDLELTATDLQTSLVTLEDRQSVVPTTPASPAPDAKQTLVEPLTPRELDVLHLMADGLTNQQIADRLVVALGTVKAYTSRIYGKLGVQNRVSAIAQARRHSLL
ncbi:MAG: tetratricopeptide repeat protein [Caldilineaceae bacterium]|nr:tetratricopeptide repeat protein [Caldilineaceae bacterium]